MGLTTSVLTGLVVEAGSSTWVGLPVGVCVGGGWVGWGVVRVRARRVGGLQTSAQAKPSRTEPAKYRQRRQVQSSDTRKGEGKSLSILVECRRRPVPGQDEQAERSRTS